MNETMIASKCPNCNSIVPKSKVRRVFCSPECKTQWHNHNRVLPPNITVECCVCGKKKERYVAPSNQTGRERFCSRKCKGIALSGSNHPMWNGGEIVCNGYVLVFSPSHPLKDSAGRVKRNRLVMEEKLGRYLTREEVVHHSDENTMNDDPENLELFASQSDHKKYHESRRIHDELGRYTKGRM